MTLKELRLSKELTQNQVADLVGISLRSYKEYENDINKVNTLKYNYIYNELSKFDLIDEEHGILKLDSIKKLYLMFWRIMMLIIAIYLVAIQRIRLMS